MADQLTAGPEKHEQNYLSTRVCQTLKMRDLWFSVRYGQTRTRNQGGDWQALRVRLETNATIVGPNPERFDRIAPSVFIFLYPFLIRGKILAVDQSQGLNQKKFTADKKG
jgi:hypothetical protein